MPAHARLARFDHRAVLRARPGRPRSYPDAEHGMTEYKLNAAGERVSTKFAPGYFQMMADFIRKGCIGRKYGNAEIKRSAGKECRTGLK